MLIAGEYRDNGLHSTLPFNNTLFFGTVLERASVFAVFACFLSRFLVLCKLKQRLSILCFWPVYSSVSLSLKVNIWTLNGISLPFYSLPFHISRVEMMTTTVLALNISI